jgi:hypothetical protein
MQKICHFDRSGTAFCPAQWRNLLFPLEVRVSENTVFKAQRRT